MWGSLGNPLAWPAAVCLSGPARWLAGQHPALSGGLSVCLACLPGSSPSFPTPPGHAPRAGLQEPGRGRSGSWLEGLGPSEGQTPTASPLSSQPWLFAKRCELGIMVVPAAWGGGRDSRGWCWLLRWSGQLLSPSPALTPTLTPTPSPTPAHPKPRVSMAASRPSVCSEHRPQSRLSLL